MARDTPSGRHDDQYSQYLREQGLAHIQNIHGIRPLIYHIPQNSQMEEPHHGTTWIADRTIRWLKENGRQPFLLFATWIQPHPPWTIPKAWQGIYGTGPCRKPAPWPSYPFEENSQRVVRRQRQRRRQAQDTRSLLLLDHHDRQEHRPHPGLPAGSKPPGRHPGDLHFRPRGDAAGQGPVHQDGALRSLGAHPADHPLPAEVRPWRAQTGDGGPLRRAADVPGRLRARLRQAELRPGGGVAVRRGAAAGSQHSGLQLRVCGRQRCGHRAVGEQPRRQVQVHLLVQPGHGGDVRPAKGPARRR